MKKLEYEYDVFISHAVEDKIPIANQLYQLLKEQNLNVWYSGRELSVGDRLTPTIHQGMDKCRFGVVIISPTYLSKIWALNEFFFLLTREKNGDKVVLPVLYDITPEELAYRSPLMADIFAVRASKGLDHVANVLSTEIRKQYQIKKSYPARPIRLMPLRKTSMLTSAIFLLLAIISHLIIPESITRQDEIEKTNPSYPQDRIRIRTSPEGASRFTRMENEDRTISTLSDTEFFVPFARSFIVIPVCRHPHAQPVNTDDHYFTKSMNLRRQPGENYYSNDPSITSHSVNGDSSDDSLTETRHPPYIVTITVDPAWRTSAPGVNKGQTWP